jgi:hypothetical protein
MNWNLVGSIYGRPSLHNSSRSVNKHGHHRWLLFLIGWFNFFFQTWVRVILYRGSQFYWWRNSEYLEKTIDLSQVTDKLHNIMLYDFNFRVDNKAYAPHGKLVVRFIENNGGLHMFEKRWRQHFVNTMKPQFLPKNWSIHHRHERHDMLTHVTHKWRTVSSHIMYLSNTDIRIIHVYIFF